MGGRGSAGRSRNNQPHQPRPGRQQPSRPATDRIRDAFTTLAGDGEGRWVSLVEIRAQLADLPRAEVDAALRQLIDDDRVRLEPEQISHRIGPQEHDAAIHIGGEDRHHLRIYPPDPR